MTELIHLEGTKTWVAKGVDCGENSTTCILTFSHSGNTSLGTISVGDKPVGVIALSSWIAPDCSAMGKVTDESLTPITEAQCEIDPISGVQDVTITVKGQAVLHSVAFTDRKPYADMIYTPVPEKNLVDLASDTWEATDMLGRKVASVEDVKGKTRERKVGIFYWTWQEAHAHLRPVDVTNVLEKYPSAEYAENHPAWGERPFQCFWHEPFYGFYRNSDPYIIRHHMALLSAAGVDMIAFDCTNGALLWRDAYEPLFKGMHEARLDGIRTPQIVFMLNLGIVPETTTAMLYSLYQNLYKPGLYSDLWYCQDGKPVIMAYDSVLPEQGVCETDDRILREIKEFFCFRPGQPGYGCGTWHPNQWGWLEIFPQHKYCERPDGTCEMMTVGVGQNANKDRICTHFNDVGTFGRSYTYKHGHDLLTKDSYKYGYNVQEQWDRAIDMDPDLVFVTGWNEWIMGQWKEPWLSDPDSPQLAMVDQYDREHSRDIEMDRDGYLDTYYLQLAHNIRRYKGAKPRVKVSEPQSINVSGGETQWKKVTPVYRNPKGTTIHRDWDGFAGCHYVNDTGRNDIVEAKVTRDAENLYFFVKCADAITPREGDGWMTLLLDTDRSKATGWEGYDLAINRINAPKGKCIIERYVPTVEAGSFTWEKMGVGKLHVKGNTLTLSIPRTLVGMEGSLNFEFKWSDNMQDKNIMDFYENGDTAPLGRFNYLYKE